MRVHNNSFNLYPHQSINQHQLCLKWLMWAEKVCRHSRSGDERWLFWCRGWLWWCLRPTCSFLVWFQWLHVVLVTQVSALWIHRVSTLPNQDITWLGSQIMSLQIRHLRLDWHKSVW
ncbi:unnamed protein product [Brassica oleracea var. botrytis]